jgi:hypothetical protein
VNGTEKEAEAVVWWQAWNKQEPYKLTSETGSRFVSLRSKTKPRQEKIIQAVFKLLGVCEK